MAGPSRSTALFAYATRIFWLLAQPLSLIVLLLAAALLLSRMKRRWPARVMVALALLLLFTCSFTTFGYLLIAPLETRFGRGPEPDRIDGIVVLGGGMDGEVNTVRGGFELNRSGDRFVEALRLALKHPEARIIIAGGPAALVRQEPEALAGRRFFEAFGIAAGRITLDDQSRNTEENAVFAKRLTGATEGQTWLLITSAFHMPRAVGLFRRAGFSTVPWPADYLASGEEGVRIKPDQASENMAVASLALREWAGLAGYYMTGRIDELVPGP